MQFTLPRSSQATAFLRRWQLPLLAAITLLAAFLRFYRLPDMPPGLFSDEGWWGMMGRSVYLTGNPQVFFPTNQGAEPIAAYLAIPVLALLGTPTWQLRIPEAIVGTLTAPALWWMCREVFGRRSASPASPPTEDEFVASSLMGLGAALAIALLFWHISLSRVGLEPILVPLTMCLAFAALARAIDTNHWLDYALAGLALASNLYTYKAGYAVPPLAALFVAHLALTDRGFLRRHWRGLAVWVAVAILAYVPMISFIAGNPNEFLMRFRSVTVESQVTPQLDLASNVVKTLRMFFIAGDENQRYNIPGRAALDPVMGVLFVIGLGVSAAGWRRPRQSLPILWLIVMCLPTTFSEFAPQWGRAIGVTPMLAVLCAMGGLAVWRLGAAMPTRWTSAGTLGGLTLAVIISGGISIRDYFTTFAQEKFLFYSFDEGHLALGEYVNTVPSDQRVYIVTDLPYTYTLPYVIERPYVVHNSSGEVYPPSGQHAVSVMVFPGARQAYRDLQAMRPDAAQGWSVKDREGRFFARALELPALAAPAPEPSHKTEAELAGTIRLLGYDIDIEQVAPGDTITVTLYWRALKAIPADFTVFTHLIGDGALLAGSDSQPLLGSYPTSVWAPGETILDRHTIIIPADAPTGVVSLRAGMYLLATLERLPAADMAGAPLQDNSIDLGTVEVIAAK